MGHKVHPIGFRLGIIKDWQARWYADDSYADFILEDVKIRRAIRAKYSEAAISLIDIERQAKEVTITLHTARPGIVIGRGGQRVDEMRQYLEGITGKRVRLNVQEVRQPELDAYLVAKSIAEQIERRVAYRRAMKQAIFRTMQAGAKGIRISAGGRLGDAEIARRQTMHQGQVPLHTLRADIDYGFAEAHTTFGRIGVKAWIYKGQVLPEARKVEAEEAAEQTAPEAIPAPAAQAPAIATEERAEARAEAAPAVEEKSPAKPRRARTAPPAESAQPAAAEASPAPAQEGAPEKPARTRTRRPRAAEEAGDIKEEGAATETAAPESAQSEDEDATT
ncbi:MAG: 30S ribosomal protein S3 [Chloroflexi bacterium]|nr:30S ribosomal protein S3 [Chloroflexota bacterium]